MQESLEDFRFAQRLQHAMLILDAQCRTDSLDSFLDPFLLLGVHDVAVLDARRATVRLAQYRKDLLQGRLSATRESVDHEGALEVPHRQAVVRDVQFRMQGRRVAVERIEVRVQVSADSVHVDQLLHADLLQDSLGVTFAE